MEFVQVENSVVWKWNVFYCNKAQPPPLLSRRIPEHRYIM